MMFHTPPLSELLTLVSDDIEVSLLPGKGADVYSYVDRRTGVDVLFKTPWGWRDPATLAPGPDSQSDWLARYAGGWQMLLPNAGPERTQDGVVLGYHGEAATRCWQVLAVAQRHAQLMVELLTVPLRIERDVSVDGPRLHIRDVVRNLSDSPVRVHWVQHPAFGAPFVDGQTRIDASARTFLTDADNPGTNVVPGVLVNFPSLPTTTGPEDLRMVPAQEDRRAVFGALTNFPQAAWFTVTSPTCGFGVRMDWQADVFPHAWFWQECHATQGFPWFRRAYTIAIEPANVLPGTGSIGRLWRGEGPYLPGGQEISTELTFTRFDIGHARS